MEHKVNQIIFAVILCLSAYLILCRDFHNKVMFLDGDNINYFVMLISLAVVFLFDYLTIKKNRVEKCCFHFIVIIYVCLFLNHLGISW
jgi:hypothetical protein